MTNDSDAIDVPIISAVLRGVVGMSHGSNVMVGLVLSPYNSHTNESGNGKIIVAITRESFNWLHSKMDEIMSFIGSDSQDTAFGIARLRMDKLFGNN